MNQKETIQSLMKENGVDALLLFSEQNRYWYSNFRSSLGYLLITNQKTVLLLDGRYITAAREATDLMNVDELIWFTDLKASLTTLFEEQKIHKVGFESDWLIYQDVENFQKTFPNQQWIALDTSKVRMVKNEGELLKLQKACDITNQVFEAVLTWAKPGITEKDLAIFVNKKFLDFGAEKLSFDTIVASGINGSKPHAIPTDKKLVAGELVTLDMGCYYQGYASDQTRTFMLGTELDSELLKIYNTVYEAQSLGISLAKPGVQAKTIHEAVAKFIADAGYGDYFTHGLGHGYGIEIHEQPYVSLRGEEVLKPGMTITVEPGIYVPDFGGVRIEDDLVITDSGARILTSSIRELQKIPV